MTLICLSRSRTVILVPVATPAVRVRLKNTSTSSEPTFTLVGTSRVGDSTAVVLRHSSGEQVRVQYAGRPTQIAGYEGFFVSGVAGRSVSIRHPSNSPCVAIEDKGVDCDQADNTSHIRLTTATAISAESEALRDAQALPDEPPKENRTNPFDAIRRSADNGIPAPHAEIPRGFGPAASIQRMSPLVCE